MKSSDYKKGRESLLKDLLRIGSREVSYQYDSGRFVIDLGAWDRFCKEVLEGKEKYYNLLEEVGEEERKEKEKVKLSKMKVSVTHMKKEIPLLEMEIAKRERERERERERVERR